MSSRINLGDQFLFVANRRLSALVRFACEVGQSVATSDSERAHVDVLLAFEDAMWPGIGFDLDEVFATLDAKKWWARVFHLVAGRIYRRAIGNQDDQTWQPSTIGDAYVVARMLTHAVQCVEQGWHPSREDTDAVESVGGALRIRG
jgi:hypothetical protein